MTVMTDYNYISVLKEGMDTDEEVIVTVAKGKILCASKSFLSAPPEKWIYTTNTNRLFSD